MRKISLLTSAPRFPRNPGMFGFIPMMRSYRNGILPGSDAAPFGGAAAGTAQDVLVSLRGGSRSKRAVQDRQPQTQFMLDHGRVRKGENPVENAFLSWQRLARRAIGASV